MGVPFGNASIGVGIVVGTCTCVTNGEPVGREVLPRIGGRIGLGEGDSMEFGICSHDGDGPGDVPSESSKADEGAFLGN